MADSHRLTVLKRLTVFLEGTVVSPYAGLTLPSTLAGLVFRGRAVFGDSDPETMVSILEAPRQGAESMNAEGATYGQWQLLLQGWTPEDRANPTDPVYSLAEDVERRLRRITAVSGETGYPKYPDDYYLGPDPSGTGRLITDFSFGSPMVRPAMEKVSSRAFFYIPLQVGMARIAVE